MGCTSSSPEEKRKPRSLFKEGPRNDSNCWSSESESENNSVHQERFDCRQRYKVYDEVGRGSFSIVRRGYDSFKNKTVAIKCIQKRNLSAEDTSYLNEEIVLLRKLQHPNIIRLHGFYEDRDSFYVVTDYAGRGDLLKCIVEKRRYFEKHVQEIIRHIATALQYCHNQNVVHRDLKPENILVMRTSNETIVKLADFGFAKRMDHNQKLLSCCGTPQYAAPEIINGKGYGKTVDMWSIGVITYLLLSGYPPFVHKEPLKLFDKIRSGRFDFKGRAWNSVSPSAKSVVQRLLVVDVEQRLTIHELLQHPWLSKEEYRIKLRLAHQNLKRYQSGYGLQPHREPSKSTQSSQLLLPVMKVAKVGEPNITSLHGLDYHGVREYQQEPESVLVAT